jgi:hypothetical protein
MLSWPCIIMISLLYHWRLSHSNRYWTVCTIHTTGALCIVCFIQSPVTMWIDLSGLYKIFKSMTPVTCTACTTAGNKLHTDLLNKHTAYTGSSYRWPELELSFHKFLAFIMWMNSLKMVYMQNHTCATTSVPDSYCMTPYLMEYTDTTI